MPPFRTSAKIRFYDMDRAGMVFHGAYTRVFQDAFEELMEEIGFIEKHLEASLDVRVPVVQHEMTFLRPPEGDELSLEVGIASMGDSSATFHLEARDLDAVRTVAKARIVRVCIGPEGSSVPIPDPLREGWKAHRVEVDARAQG